MAKFTSTRDLNIKWANHHFVGVAGTTHRVTDALVEEFTERVVPHIPGFAWVTQDELSAGGLTLPLAVASGGTGASSALAARSNLGLTYDVHVASYESLQAVSDATTAHIADTFAAHPASAISIADASSLYAATNVEDALQEIGNKAPVGATYLVTTSDPTLQAEVVVGETPGGELGGTWPSPTVDTIHSGSAHVITSSGTSFPGSPATNALAYRTDHDLLFFYDGTRWLSTDLFTLVHATNSGTVISATNTEFPWPVPVLAGTDIWLEDFTSQFFVSSGGTALGASHKWVGVLAKRDSANTATTLATHNIDSGSSAVWRTGGPTAIDALLGNGTTYYAFSMVWTKTGTPGNLNAQYILSYRLVAT